jgi:hypothetical protein
MKITNINTGIEIKKHLKRKMEAWAQSGPARPTLDGQVAQAQAGGMAGQPNMACPGVAWCFYKGAPKIFINYTTV